MKHNTTRSLIAVYGTMILAHQSNTNWFTILMLIMSFINLVFYIIGTLNEKK